MPNALKTQAANGIYRAVTRAEIEQCLDNHELFAAMHYGGFWEMRRNGRTQTWKRDPNRIRIPFKVGLKECGAITENDFRDGILKAEFYRHKEDLR